MSTHTSDNGKYGTARFHKNQSYSATRIMLIHPGFGHNTLSGMVRDHPCHVLYFVGMMPLNVMLRIKEVISFQLVE